MNWIDWTIIGLPLVSLVWVGYYTRRHVRGVADFLSGGRLAGRYLLAVAKGEQGVGAVVFVALFEQTAKSGFILTWWGWMTVPVGIIVAISGWVIYRFRETRALTLAQFFEIRYSKRFRIFTGLLAFIAGMLNFGIIPAVGARFLTYFLGLPQTVHLLAWDIPTYIPLMAVLLGLTLALTLSGGLITLMITNCLEGMISQVLFLVVIFWLLSMFHWSQINVVLSARPVGQSFLNPFDSFGLKDFNIWLVLMGVWGLVYRTMAWQNQSAYSAAAITAHESRMGAILSNWRGMVNQAVIALLAVCAMTYLAHPDFAAPSGAAKAEIHQIAQVQTQEQMTIPIAVTHLLPVGVKGALCVILLMGVFGGDGTHLLSWGSIFIQDVILPFRKTPITPREHVRLLRWSMAGVASFAFLFGSLFHQTEYIFMWWAVTESLYVGGAGVAIIGGLYWKKGTTAGAWAGLITGSGLVTFGILARQVMEDRFPLNGTQIGFFGSLIAVLVYIVTSWLTCREDFNMDRLLHRGRYEVKAEKQFEPKPQKQVIWGKLMGLDEHFTRGDKWLAGSIFGWSILWFSVFACGSIWNLIAPWPPSVWSDFWGVVGIGVPIFFAVVTAVWFTWGGIQDMRIFFKRLKHERIDVLDNGMVVDHRNRSDLAPQAMIQDPDKEVLR
jgi:solute:Na+ symporter, SSS family